MANNNNDTSNNLEDLLKLAECAICCELKTDHRILVSCGHSFCKDDIQLIIDTRDLKCPLCRKPFTVPNDGVNSLIKDFHKIALVELALKWENSSLDTSKSEICSACSKPATQWCQEDECLFCETHAEEAHRFGKSKNHTLVAPAKKIVKVQCTSHKKELEKFCHTCDKVICVDCFIFEHQGHKIENADVVIEEKKKNLSSNGINDEQKPTKPTVPVDPIQKQYNEELMRLQSTVFELQANQKALLKNSVVPPTTVPRVVQQQPINVELPVRVSFPQIQQVIDISTLYCHSNKRFKPNNYYNLDESDSDTNESLQIKYNNPGYRQEDGTWEYTHRRVAEKSIGREIMPGEHVHHINKNKIDNRPQNLAVLDSDIHRRVHTSEWHEKNVCFTCGRAGHFAQECYAKSKWNGESLYESDSSEDEPSYSYGKKYGNGFEGNWAFGGYDSFSDDEW